MTESLRRCQTMSRAPRQAPCNQTQPLIYGKPNTIFYVINGSQFNTTVTTNVISNEVPTPAVHAVHTSFADALAPSNISRKMTTRSQTNSLKPKQPYVGFIKYPLPHALLAQSCHAPVEPMSFTNASKDHK